MARQTRAAEKKAVEQRTQQRLAAHKEAAERGVETRRRNREAQVKRQRAKTQEQRPAATQATEPQQGQAQAADGQSKRPERNVAQKGRARPGGQASEPMATVALRGESASRLRALAAAQEMTLSELLVRMMEVFEAQTG